MMPLLKKIYAPFQKTKKKFTLLYMSEIQNWRIKINRRLRVLPNVMLCIFENVQI